MGIYNRKIVEQKDAALAASRAQADATFMGDGPRTRQAAADVDAALDRINELKAMEKYRAS
jgi:hypothetical protein